jgi:hypothetical protein
MTMIDSLILRAFHEKVADLVFGPRGDAPVTAAGAFVGRQGGGVEFQSLLRETGSFQKAKAAYQKKHPKDYVTLAFLREKAPTRGGFLGIGGDPHIKARLKNYQERSKSPRMFIREGEPGGYAQQALYKEVRRGLRDDELNNPWVPKKQRVVYI